MTKLALAIYRSLGLVQCLRLVVDPGEPEPLRLRVLGADRRRREAQGDASIRICIGTAHVELRARHDDELVTRLDTRGIEVGRDAERRRREVCDEHLQRAPQAPVETGLELEAVPAHGPVLWHEHFSVQRAEGVECRLLDAMDFLVHRIQNSQGIGARWRDAATKR